MTYKKVTARSVREDARGRWLEIFQHMCPGMFDDAIANLGEHVTCPFHGGVDDFRFLKIGSKKGGSTADTGVALCTCKVRSDGLNVLEDALPSTPFMQILREVDAFLKGNPMEAHQVTAAPVSEKQMVPEEDLLARRKKLWNPARPLFPDNLAYFLNRGIRREVLERAESLRFLPELAYWQPVRGSSERTRVGDFPAILGLMRNAEDYPVAVHRTWLSLDGQAKAPVNKAKKLTQSHDATGAAIRLFDAQGAEVLGLGEGIETALSAFDLAEEGYWAAEGIESLPVWASYSSANIQNFIVPSWLKPTLKKIVVFEDNDLNGTGHAAKVKLAERMESEGIEVIGFKPKVTGYDWNDVLRSHRAS